MVELLKQGQYQPLPVEKQVVIIYAGTQGLLDDVPVDAVREFETFFYAWLERRAPQILTEIRDRKEISDALRDTLTKRSPTPRRSSPPPRASRRRRVRRSRPFATSSGDRLRSSPRRRSRGR